MNNQTNYSGMLEDLKRRIASYQVGDVNWSLEDKIFLDRLEQLPFDFQIVQCLKGQKFDAVKGLQRSFGHSDKLFDIDSFYWNIHPDDKYEVVASDLKLLNWLSTARSSYATNTLLTAQFRFSDKSGKYHLLNRNSMIIKSDQDGRACCLYHTFVDVTETQQFGRVKYRFQHPGKRPARKVKIERKNFDLTKREREVLRLIVRGFSSREISSELYISRETVYRHRKNMIKKSNVKDTKSLAMRAVSENWV